MEMKKYMTRGVQECIPFDLVGVDVANVMIDVRRR